jgi:hypothetical protein
MENPTTIAIDLSKGVGVQWELRPVLALGDRWVRRRSRTLSERRDPLQCPFRIFVTALQAAFRTNAGNIPPASRYSTRNGESIGSSPGLPRRGGQLPVSEGDKSASATRHSAPQFPLPPL